MFLRNQPIHRKKLISLAIGCLLVIALIPLPLKTTPKDKEILVSRALAGVLQNQRVFTEKGYAHLRDTSFIMKKDKNRIYFENDLGIPDTVFLEFGLKPILKDQKIFVDQGGAIISFSNRDIEGNPATYIQFSYVFGSLGAQGYEIRMYKSIVLRYFFFLRTWVS